MQPELSVIMALYNTLPYLDKCVESVLSQSFANFELIVIDNVSDDGSYEYMEAIAAADKRVKLHRRERHGNASTSREIGRRLSYGRYITYVDSDDSVKPGMYERLMRCARETDSDIVVCNYDMVYPEKIMQGYSLMDNATIEVAADGYERYFYRYFCMERPNNYLWTRIIRRELFADNGIYIPDVEITEDTIFTMLCTSVARQVTHIPEAYYNYYQREDSTVRELVRKDDVALRYVQAFEKVVRMLAELGLSERFSKIMPFYAYTRIRSIIFYKGLTQTSSPTDFEMVKATISGSSLPIYLRLALKSDFIERFTGVHGLSTAPEIRAVIKKCL